MYAKQWISFYALMYVDCSPFPPPVQTFIQSHRLFSSSPFHFRLSQSSPHEGFKKEKGKFSTPSLALKNNNQSFWKNFSSSMSGEKKTREKECVEKCQTSTKKSRIYTKISPIIHIQIGGTGGRNEKIHVQCIIIGGGGRSSSGDNVIEFLFSMVLTCPDKSSCHCERRNWTRNLDLSPEVSSCRVS